MNQDNSDQINTNNSNSHSSNGKCLENADNSIYIGLVAPLGTPLDKMTNWIKEMVRQYSYRGKLITISDHFGDIKKSLKIQLPGRNNRENNGKIEKSEAYQEMEEKIKLGDMIREHRGNDYLAKYTIDKIHSLKTKVVDDEMDSNQKKRNIYIIRQFKHVDEITLMRRTYGCNFYLMGIHATEELRMEHLTRKKGLRKEEALELINRDADENEDHGQKTTKVFVLSDYFFRYNGGDWNFKQQLQRFYDLIFGNIMITPTDDEFGMYTAFAASCRSGSISRQVGASILTPKGELVATGHNDTPCFGGGWMTIDPIKSGSNWYAYVGNDPVNFVDFLGLEPGPPPNPTATPDPGEIDYELMSLANAAVVEFQGKGDRNRAIMDELIKIDKFKPGYPKATGIAAGLPLKPGVEDGVTHCNELNEEYGKRTNADQTAMFSPNPKGYNDSQRNSGWMNAETIVDNLDENVKQGNIQELTEEEAYNYANMGGTVIAGADPNEHNKSGHLAAVMKDDNPYDPEKGVLVGQAGSKEAHGYNYTGKWTDPYKKNDPNSGFGLDEVKYYFLKEK